MVLEGNSVKKNNFFFGGGEFFRLSLDVCPHTVRDTQQSTGHTRTVGLLNNITLHNKTCCHNTLFIQRN